MTTAEITATAAAEAEVTAAGFTPCEFSGFVHNGKAHAFSVESANGFSESGPAFESIVPLEVESSVN